jgi:hypothetical protein
MLTFLASRVFQSGVIRCAWVVSLCAGAAWPATSKASGPVLQVVTRDGLCVTNGSVVALSGGRLGVDSASSRAVAQLSAGTSAEIRFRYLGPSVGSKPLASGEMRRQIGLKLMARDTCNLVYVMWHIEPDARIGVSVKRNPGQHSHGECHANGYTTLRASHWVDLPRILPGEQHSLRADLQGERLEVVADGRPAWTGSLKGTSIDFVGPTGFRTDNARFEFEYLTTSPAADARRVDRTLNRCEQGPGD